MGAKESEAMKKAKILVLEKGYNASQAAKKVGLTKSAIYMTEWWKNERLQNKQLSRIQDRT